MNSYRYDNNISDISFRYVFETKKDNGVIQKSVKVDYYKMLEILDFKDKKDDLGISYNKCTSRQLQFISHLISKSDDVLRCNVFVGGQIII
tara:strand:+ start:757 stop:1029 length:273 start_codon:yes stop_codon:yes gene_type:complete